MRPLRLDLTAFGPYVGHQTVDFRRLAATGLFLVAGPTGTGKSSIFDALCFGLYGRLPGQRSVYRTVRSDHAAEGERCAVSVEFEAAGDRWRVSRQPEHHRPKKRGRGFTTDPQTAQLERWTGSDWQTTATRPSEVSVEIHQLVGLTYQQFERVVLLPQGRFQQALLAGSKERRELLSSLFRTSTLGEVEAELVTRSAAAKAELDRLDLALEHDLRAALDAIERARTVLLIEHRVGVPVSVGAGDMVEAFSDGPVVSEPELAPEPEVVGDSVTPSLAGLRAEVSEVTRGPLAALVERRGQAEAERARLAHEAATAAEIVANIAERDRLRRRRVELDAGRSPCELGRELAAKGRAARQVVDAERVRADIEGRLRSARVATEEAYELVEAELGPCGYELPSLIDMEDLHHLGEAVLRDQEVVEELRRKVSQAEAARESAHRAEQEIALAAEELSHQREKCEELETTRSELQAEREELAVSIGRLDAARVEVDTIRSTIDQRRVLASLLDALVDQRSRRDELAAQLVHIEAGREELANGLTVVREIASRRAWVEGQLAETQSRLSRREHLEGLGVAYGAALRDLRQIQSAQVEVFDRFVATMGPRLAEQLVDEVPCPVCGSKVHPVPAERDPQGPPATLALVQEVQDQLQAKAAHVGAVHAELQATKEGLGADADVPIDQLQGRVAEVRTDLADAIAAEDRERVGTDRLADLVRQAQDGAAGIGDLDEQMAETERAAATVRGALGDAAARSIEELIARQVQGEAALEALMVDERRHSLVGLELDRHVATLARLEKAMTTSQRRIDRASATHGELSRQARALSVEVGDRFAAHDPDQLADALSRAGQAIGVARASVHEADRLTRDSHDRAAQVDSYLSISGLASVRDAEDAYLALEDIERLEAEWARWEKESNDVDSRLGVYRDLELPDMPPDVEALALASRRSAEHYSSLVDRVGRGEEALDRAEGVLRKVAQRGEETAARRAEAETVHRLAETCRGNNAKRTTLESWVLAGHLRRVVRHANVHLGEMSAGRYRLAVPTDAVKSQGYAGLDLVVVDSFTGRERPTASLSGGETFQASLALALGLADVVGAGRAGLSLDALFIDEGFGSLDSDALDQAVQVLERLRGRGALIGVVTHVEALKDSLPVGLRVESLGPGEGSTIVQAC